MSKRQQEEEQPSSESDAPEEESNVATRRSIKSIDRSRKVPKRSNANTAAKSQSKVIVESKDNESANTTSNNEASTSTSPSHKLDPSLFAASFAKKRTIAPFSTLNKVTSKSILLEQTKPIKKRFGVAKGYDGQPMKRLKDGRTTVRVLHSERKNKPTSDSTEIIEETLQPPSALAPTEVLPNAKIRGFRKQKLGLREEIKKAPAAKKAFGIEEDPLGLEDPAFMKGGELEGVGLVPKRQLKGTPRPSTQFRGRRTKFTPAMTKHNQALQFARSV